MSALGNTTGGTSYDAWSELSHDEQGAPRDFKPGALVSTWSVDRDANDNNLGLMQNTRFYNHALYAHQTVIAWSRTGANVFGDVLQYDAMLEGKLTP